MRIKHTAVARMLADDLKQRIFMHAYYSIWETVYLDSLRELSPSQCAAMASEMLRREFSDYRG
jgi:hypothetical protein